MLEFEGPSDSFYCPFHVASFLTLLFAVENIAIWGAWPLDPLDPPLLIIEVLVVIHLQL